MGKACESTSGRELLRVSMACGEESEGHGCAHFAEGQKSDSHVCSVVSVEYGIRSDHFDFSLKSNWQCTGLKITLCDAKESDFQLFRGDQVRGLGGEMI